MSHIDDYDWERDVDDGYDLWEGTPSGFEDAYDSSFYDYFGYQDGVVSEGANVSPV